MTIEFKPQKIDVTIGGGSIDVSTGTPVIRELPASYEGASEVTPSEETQTLATDGLMLNSNIIVNPIPSQYIIPQGALAISENGEIDVSQYAQANVAVPSTLGLYTIRPDTELIKTYSHDSLVVTDDKVTLPAYNSSKAVTIKASGNLSGTVDLDYENYYYFAIERFLTIPVYNTNTIAASRNDYAIGSVMYELVDIPSNTFKAKNGTLYGSRSVGVATYSLYRMLYWSSASAVGVYTATTYGISQVTAAPTISSGKWTFKSPTLQFRGSSTYLTSAVYGTITDIRQQFVINVYRVPKNHLNIDGWGIYQQAMHIIDCASSANQNLT